MTSTAKQPKAKFSSRNLSAVFKAPLRTKPLPDHATGPLPRNNGRLLVLGKAAAAPAPVNTPSLRKESQVLDARVSLVPASSNWATNAAVLAEKPAEEPKQVEPAPAEPAVQSPVPEKAWTPESVAEHLHTAPAARPSASNSSGRWGDDAVEHDIVQTNIRLQRQKERDFPDLKEAVEEHPHDGHAPAAESRSLSMEPQEHRPRATGRWAHFSEQETRRPMGDDRWSRDRYEEDRWGRGREDDRWSRDRYSRFDDEYGRESRRYEPAQGSRMVSPIPNDSRTHFSSSDARFDMVAPGDSVLSHSPHRMDWSRRSLGRSPSPRPEGSRFRNERSSASQSPSPATPTLAAAPAPAPARPNPWRRLSPSSRGSPSPVPNAWRKSEEDAPSTPVAAADESSTESSSNSSPSSSPIPAQQVQLLKRAKMLFDPKTGAMVDAGDEVTSGKRPIGSRGGSKGRDVQKDARTNRKQAQKVSMTRSLEKADGTEDTKLPASTETDSVEASPAGKDSETSSISSGVLTPVDNVGDTKTSKSDNAQRERGGRNRSPTKEKTADAASSNPWKKQPLPETQRRQSSQKKLPGSRQTKATSANSELDSSSARGAKAAERGTRNRGKQQKPSAGQKPIEATSTEAQQPKVSSAEEVALLQQIADGSTGRVVIVTGAQEGIEVQSEDGEFETVKSRRVLLSEKKQIQAQKRKQPFAKRATSEQSKSEAVQENFGFASSKRAPSKPFAGKKGARGATNDKAVRSAKQSPGQPKHSPETTESKEENQASADDAAVRTVRVTKRAPRHKSARARDSGNRETATANSASPTKPTEQLAGEAAAESPMAKSAKSEKKRGQQTSWVEKRASKSPARASSAGAKRQPGGAKRDRIIEKESGSDASVKVAGTTMKKKTEAKPRATARPKQAKQMYVVKTPAPSAAAATSTAA